MTFSGLVVVFTLSLPEVSLSFFSSNIALLTSIQTPRWLMANDRTEEALDVMAKYHGEGDRNSPIVQLEYEEMRNESKSLLLLFRIIVDTLQLTSPRQAPTSFGGITANYSTLEKFGTEQCSWYSCHPLLHVFTNKFLPRLSSANGQEMALHHITTHKCSKELELPTTTLGSSTTAAKTSSPSAALSSAPS
jgi:hypothetical protein